MLANDHTVQKFDPAWLDEGTYRNLFHWSVILDLDPRMIEEGDSFFSWAIRCGMDVRSMDEGGGVVRRPGGSFFYIPATSLLILDQEVTEAFNSSRNGPAE